MHDDLYQTFPFTTAADALAEVREQFLAGKRLKWTGPDRLHHSISATTPPPSWNFSREGMEHHEDQGRTFWDVYTMVAFQLGFHNGVLRR